MKGSGGELVGNWPILAAHESSLWRSISVGNYTPIISGFKMGTHFAAFSYSGERPFVGLRSRNRNRSRPLYEGCRKRTTESFAVCYPTRREANC